MFKPWMSRLLMKPEGDPAGGGGAPPASSTLLGGDPATPPAAPATPAAPVPPTDWRASLPVEMQEDASLKKYKNVADLANAYKNAQKIIGGPKLALPNENTTEQEWKDIYKKLGVPEKIEDYNVKFKDGTSIDAKFGEDFKALAHKLGIHPKQAQGLAEWFSDANLNATIESTKARDASFAKTVEGLKSTWGDAFDINVARANKVVTSIGGPEMVEHFKQLGLGADQKTMVFLAKLGETLYKEDKLVGGNPQGNPVLTPAEIKASINKIMGDTSNPYHLKDHPGHKEAVAEMRRLHESLYKPAQA